MTDRLGDALTDWLRAEAPERAPTHLLTDSLARVADAGQERYLTQRLFGDVAGRSPRARLGLAIAVALLALAGAVAFAGSQLLQPTTPPIGAFGAGPTLLTGRGMHSATLLRDGRVLIVGGNWHVEAQVELAESAEIWDPRSDAGTPATSFRLLSAPAVARSEHTATRLPDGRVLLVGGSTDPRAEIWDPGTESFMLTGSLSEPRSVHTATLLPDGRVLIVGGRDDRRAVAGAEIWDPASGTFSAAGSLATARFDHTTTLLADGRVLVVGGTADTTEQAPFRVAEVWDPATATFSPAGSTVAQRSGHAATLLADGRVLVVGGWDSPSTEVWDPQTGSFSVGAPLDQERSGPIVMLLRDGRVLVAGGTEDHSALVWQPDTERFVATGSLNALRWGSDATATLLDDGRVLIVGDVTRQRSIATTEIWDPGAQPVASSPAPLTTPAVTGTPPPVPAATGG